MDVDKVPILGKINRSLTTMMVNFILLGVICAVLGVLIPFFPKVLDLLVAALLIVSALLLFHIAWNIHSTKKKYMKWFE